MVSATRTEQSLAIEEAAVRYGKLGFYIIPLFGIDPTTGWCDCGELTCDKPGKHTWLSTWKESSYRSEQMIRGWWLRRPNSNIGIDCGKSKIVVIDIDPKNGGNESMEMLRRDHGELEPTLTVTTGSGGTHYYYHASAEEIKNSVSKIAPGVDIRSVGGYVVAAPSMHVSGNAYTLDGEPCAPGVLPVVSPLIAELAATTGRQGADGTWEPLVLPPRIHDGIRNTMLFRFGCSLRDKGLPEQSILKMMTVASDDLCDPPLSEHEILGVARSIAYRYVPKHPLPGIGGSDGQDGNPERVPFRFWSLAEAKRRPVPSWLIKNILVENSICVISGEKDTYKTFVASSMALCIATGTPWYGHEIPQARPVFYLSGEGSDSITKRFWAWEQDHEAEPIDPAMFRIIPDIVQLLDEKHVGTLIEHIYRTGVTPSVIIIDTFARATVGSDENSVKDVGRAVAACDALRREFGATIILIHHLSKSGSVRGSTALPAGADTQISTRRDGDVLILECEKQKDFAQFAPIYLLSRLVTLPDIPELDSGENNSLIFDETTYDRAASEADSVVKTLAALQLLLLAQPDGVTASAWERAAVAGSVGRTQFFAAKSRLEKDGTVQCTSGPGKRGAKWVISTGP